MATVRIVADHINADLSTNSTKKYKLLFVPRKVVFCFKKSQLSAFFYSSATNYDHVFFCQLFMCEKVLEEEGVYGHVEIEELALDLVPLDRDILSLELPDFYRQFYLVCWRST